jgi:hypothetical protein
LGNVIGTSFATAGFSYDANISPNNQSFTGAVLATILRQTPLTLTSISVGTATIGSASITSETVGTATITNLTVGTATLTNLNVTGPAVFNSAIAASGDPLSSSTTRVITGLASFLNGTLTSTTATPAATPLSITFNETGWYTFEIYLPCYENTTGTGGAYFDLAASSITVGAMQWSYEGWALAAQTGAGFTTTAGAIGFASLSTNVAAPSWALAKGVINVTATGTQGIRFAQNTLLAAKSTVLLAGAYFMAAKIG